MSHSPGHADGRHQHSHPDPAEEILSEMEIFFIELLQKESGTEETKLPHHPESLWIFLLSPERQADDKVPKFLSS